MGIKMHDTPWAISSKIKFKRERDWLIDWLVDWLIDWLFFFQTKRLFLPMNEFYFGFEYQSPEIAIMSGVPSTAANSTFKFVIDKAVLRLKRVKTLPSFQTSFESLLQKRNALFPYMHLSCRNFSIPAAVTSYQVWKKKNDKKKNEKNNIKNDKKKWLFFFFRLMIYFLALFYQNG